MSLLLTTGRGLSWTEKIKGTLKCVKTTDWCGGIDQLGLVD